MKALNSIETNTKVRRLGYLIQIVREIGTVSLGEDAIAARLTTWSNDNLDSLNKHIDSTGVIKESLKRTSARRYLSCALKMELIAKITGEYKLTKYGKVLLTLIRQNKPSPFSLELSEICFFLNRLLLLDSDYLLTILQFIERHPECSLASIQSEFQHFIISWLDNKSKYIFLDETSKKRETLQAKNRIKSWTKPRKYVEHIVPPRTQWLLDLHMIDWEFYKKTHKFILSKEGEIFISHLPKSQKYIYVNIDWINNKYFECFIKTFLPKSKVILFTQLGDKRKCEIIYRFLEKSFKLFRTTDLMRITASQFLYYTCINLSTMDKIACSFEDLKKCLSKISRNSNGKYYFYWSAQQNDGHLTKHQK